MAYGPCIGEGGLDSYGDLFHCATLRSKAALAGLNVMANASTCGCPLSNRWLKLRGPAYSALFWSERLGRCPGRAFLKHPWIAPSSAFQAQGQLPLSAKVVLRAWCNVSSLSHNHTKPSVCFCVKNEGFVLFFKWAMPVVSKLIEQEKREELLKK